MDYIIVERIFVNCKLDGVSHKTEDGSNPEKHGEPTKELFAELDPFRRCFWRS